MPRFLSTPFLLVSTIALCSLFSQKAFAQGTSKTILQEKTKQSVPETGIEEILVTATKRSQRIKDIAASVIVINGGQLNNMDGAEQMAQGLSGVQAAIASGSRTTFQIRGIGAVDHQALTPTATAFYIDGVFMATNVQSSPLLFDLERVEILKGPQGSLYGRNASAGSIHFISARPSEEVEGYVTAGLGNHDRSDIKGAFNTPLTDKLSLRLSGRRLKESPLLDNIQTNELISAPKDGGGRQDEFGLRALLSYGGATDTNGLLKLHYGEDNGIHPGPLNDSFTSGASALRKHEISIGPDGIQNTDNEFYGISLEVNHKIGLFNITTVAAYEGYNQQHGFDFDGSPAPFNEEILNANLAYDRNLDQYSLESRANYKNNKWDLMAGLFISAEDFDQEYLIWCGQLDQNTLLGTCRYVGAPGRAGSNPASSGTAITLQSVIEQQRRTIALFTHNTFSFSPKFDLTFGARLTHETIKGAGEGRHIFDDGIVALNNRDDLGEATGSNKLSESRLTGNLGLSYNLSFAKKAYVSLSSGFKSGGFNGEVINNATHFSDEGLFRSETVAALEIGLKHQKGNLAYTVAAFHQDYNRPQARIFVPFGLEGGGSFTSNSLSNLDKATSYGLEMDTKWLVSEILTFGGSLTYLETEIHQNSSPAVPQNATTFDGNPLPLASKYSATIFVEFHKALNDKTQLIIRVDSKYQSRFYLDAEGLMDRTQKGYGMLNISAQLLVQEQWKLSVWGRNLTNSDYATAGFGFIGYNTYRGASRSYGLSLGYRF